MMGRQVVSFLCIAVACIAVLSNGALGKKFWGTSEERNEIISDAIAESKLNSQLKEESSKPAAPMGPLTSFQLLTLGFKKPSPEAVKQGKARLLMEDMVHRAEKKLVELKKKQDGSSDNPKVLAEDLAEELFHRPGVLLKKDEIARMYSETGCQEIRDEPECNHATVDTYRTIDGTCNNRRKPLQGAAQTAFRRLIPPSYEDGISTPKGNRQAMRGNIPLLPGGPFSPPYPSARFVSHRIVVNASNEEVPITHAVMQWGQFLDHDLDLSSTLSADCIGCNFTEACQPIRVPADDPVFGVEGGDDNDNGKRRECLPFTRTISTCTETSPGEFSARQQLNDLTSYVDGSQVYGSSDETASGLRSNVNGLMATSPGNNLPIEDGSFQAGDVRVNEQVGLMAMQTLWMREHNRIAGVLFENNPNWDDERLYQESRKIIGAMLQKITYSDFLPKLIGNLHYQTVLPAYTRYKRSVDASLPNSFATGAYRLGHSLVRPVFNRYLSDLYEGGTSSPIDLKSSFFNTAAYFETDLGAIFRGLVAENSLRMDESLNRVLTTELFETPTSAGMDLAALNIQRQRDHGLPSYTVIRNFCQSVFPDLPLATMRTGLITFRMLRAYGNMNNVDFWLGGISEESIPGGVVGPTFACILGLTFANLRDGDRFWYQKPGVFTPEQLEELEKASLSRVICDNTNINLIQSDAFLSNETRAACSTHPVVDLSHWTESSDSSKTGFDDKKNKIEMKDADLLKQLEETINKLE